MLRKMCIKMFIGKSITKVGAIVILLRPEEVVSNFFVQVKAGLHTHPSAGLKLISSNKRWNTR